MRQLLSILIGALFFCISCSFTFTGRYRGYEIMCSTHNNCILKKEMIFIIDKEGGFPDTVSLTYPIFLIDSANIQKGYVDLGIYLRCYLKIDSTYTFTLRPVTGSEADIELQNFDYYKINCYFPDITSNRFVERDSNAMGYNRNENKYVERNDSLYKIEGLYPMCDCRLDLIH